MRALVFLLVLGNLLFLAFAGGYFGAPDNPDAGRVGQQLVPERVRVVGYDQTPPARAEVEKLVAEAPPPVGTRGVVPGLGASAGGRS